MYGVKDSTAESFCVENNISFVEIPAVKAVSVSLDKPSVSLTKGSDVSLTATVHTADTYLKNVSRISNENIALGNSVSVYAGATDGAGNYTYAV